MNLRIAVPLTKTSTKKTQDMAVDGSGHPAKPVEVGSLSTTICRVFYTSQEVGLGISKPSTVAVALFTELFHAYPKCTMGREYLTSHFSLEWPFLTFHVEVNHKSIWVLEQKRHHPICLGHISWEKGCYKFCLNKIQAPLPQSLAFFN